MTVEPCPAMFNAKYHSAQRNSIYCAIHARDGALIQGVEWADPATRSLGHVTRGQDGLDRRIECDVDFYVVDIRTQFVIDQSFEGEVEHS